MIGVKASLLAPILTLILAVIPPATWRSAGTQASQIKAPASPGAPPQAARQAPPAPTSDDETAYMCPMHPDLTSDKPGTCPRCSMNLVLATPFDMRDYELEFQTVPRVVKAGAKATLLFKVSHPGTGEPIKKFELVHDRPYHVFVISQDMTRVLPHPSGAAAGRNVGGRRHTAQAGVLQGAVGLPPGRRLLAVHRTADRHRGLHRRSGGVQCSSRARPRADQDNRRHHRRSDLRPHAGSWQASTAT